MGLFSHYRPSDFYSLKKFFFIQLKITVSRAYLPTTARSPAEENLRRNKSIQLVLWPISEPQLAEIQCETAADSVLQSLTQVILQGWPD